VPVAPAVKVEVLDWGGNGAPLVFLAGFGNSAHIFDGFAPRFTDRFHVLGITRRGFGASSRPTVGYDSASLARDIVTVLDSLGIRRATLAAHSFGGSELNYLGAHYADRVEKLIYLDAAYDFAALYVTPGWKEHAPSRWPPERWFDDNSVASWVRWAERIEGPGYPEAEIRTSLVWGPDGQATGPSYSDSIATVLQRETSPADFRAIRVPVLAVVADPGSAPVRAPWWNALDPTTRAQIQKDYTITSAIVQAQVDRFSREVERARVVRIPGARHYVFLTHSGEVEQEMRVFLLGG
jgi:non-heme chloroperoxidase